MNVVALEGLVTGAALGRALAADLRVMAEDARLDVAAAVGDELARDVGAATARRWAGAEVTALEALRAGFAARLAPSGQAARVAAELRAAIGGGVAVEAACDLVRRAHVGVAAMLDLEDEAVRRCLTDPSAGTRLRERFGARAGADPRPGPDLRLERRGGVTLATIARPHRRNALRPATIAELGRLLAAREPLVLCGEGAAFSAGEDLRELLADFPGAALASLADVQDLTRLLAAHPRVVAALSGPAVGLGAELALACHARVATPAATLSFPEVALGLLPTNGAFAILPPRVGRARTLAWFLLGEPIDAGELFRLGLVDEVVPPAELLDAAARRAS